MKMVRYIIDIVEDYCKWLNEKGMSINIDEVLVDEKLTMEVYSALLDKCYEDKLGFFYFTQFIIGPDEFTGMRIWNRLVKFFYEKIKEHKKLNIMCSRGAGKSFMFSILYPLYVMFLFKGVEILIINNTASQVKINFDKLKSIIMDNEALTKWKPKDGEWSAEAIDYHGGKLHVRSIGGTTRGIHANIVIIDDILRQDSRYSFKYINEYVLQSVFPTSERKKGSIYVVGTPQSYLDIHHVLAEVKENSGKYVWDDDVEDDNFENGLVTGGISYRKFHNYKLGARTKDRKHVLLPELFSLEHLDEIENTIGALNFQKEYLCICMTDRTALFPELLIQKCLHRNEQIHLTGEVGGNYVVAADVATSGAASADSSAFTIIQYVELEGRMRKILRYILKVKGMPVEEQINTLEELSKNFNDASIKVEKNNVGVALIQELVNRGRIVTEFVTNKPKKEGAIRFLINEMSNGNIIIPYSKESMEFIDPLLDELRGFGIKVKSRDGKKIESMEAISGHDDCVDSFWLCNMAATEESETGEGFAIIQD